MKKRISFKYVITLAVLVIVHDQTCNNVTCTFIGESRNQGFIADNEHDPEAAASTTNR
jgi:hypothetical protein